MDFHSLWTVVVFTAFIALILWAWSSKRKDAFDEAARLPLDDESTSVSGPEVSGSVPAGGQAGKRA